MFYFDLWRRLILSLHFGISITFIHESHLVAQTLPSVSWQGRGGKRVVVLHKIIRQPATQQQMKLYGFMSWV